MDPGAIELRSREMSQDGFVVAMSTNIAVASYDRPTEIVRLIRRWTIVSRFGPKGEYLTVSVGGAICNGQTQVPIGLAPAKTAFGILLSENERQTESTFLLVRHLPRGVTIAGLFFPAEGYARLDGAFDGLRMRMEGRSAHSRGRLNAHDVRVDVPAPAPGAKWTMAWHIEAAYRPWAGEFFASSRSR